MLGALTSVYSRNAPYRRQLRTPAAVAVGDLIAAAAGESAWHVPIALLGTAVVGALATMACTAVKAGSARRIDLRVRHGRVCSPAAVVGRSSRAPRGSLQPARRSRGRSATSAAWCAGFGRSGNSWPRLWRPQRCIWRRRPACGPGIVPPWPWIGHGTAWRKSGNGIAVVPSRSIWCGWWKHARQCSSTWGRPTRPPTTFATPPSRYGAASHREWLLSAVVGVAVADSSGPRRRGSPARSARGHLVAAVCRAGRRSAVAGRVGGAARGL